MEREYVNDLQSVSIYLCNLWSCSPWQTTQYLENAATGVSLTTLQEHKQKH
jgi:hypothetical protein